LDEIGLFKRIRRSALIKIELLFDELEFFVFEDQSVVSAGVFSDKSIERLGGIGRAGNDDVLDDVEWNI